jgi:septal ring factor EnvC (AmiA/AmiB activator)
MRSQNFIFILVLLTINLTNTFDFTSFVELNDLQNDPYAKSLIETISMSMKDANGGRIENIESLLDDLLIKLINDQKNADAAWNKEKARLDNKISNLNSEIARLTAEIAQLNKEKKDNEIKRDLSRRNIVQYTAQRLADQSQLKDLTVRRHRDRAIYEASVKEHAAIIGAIEQVVAALSKLRGSVSGIGKPKHVGAIANENRDAAWKAGVKKSFIEIVGDDEEINAFVELATEADQAALEKLIALLNNVERNTKKSLADDEAAETASVQSFNRLNANLNGDVSSLDSLLKRQQTNLDGYLKRINDLTLTINIRTSLLHSRQLELKNTIQERHDKLNQYNADTAHRTQEKTTIQRLQKIVKERLSTMSNFLIPHVNK